MFELTKIRVHYSSRFCAHATYICTIYVISISRWGKHKQWMKIGVLTIVGLGRQREIDSTICSDMLGCSANLAINETQHIQKENHKAVSKHRQMASSVFRRFLFFFFALQKQSESIVGTYNHICMHAKYVWPNDYSATSTQNALRHSRRAADWRWTRALIQQPVPVPMRRCPAK